MATKPTEPFQVKFVQAKPGEKQLPAEWAAPFDTSFRPLEAPNAPEESYPAYAAIGWHVTQYARRYCPPYRIMETLNLRKTQSPGVMEAWEKKTRDELLVTDRRSGTVTWLSPSYSIREAVISWFVRESGHEGQVLCFDHGDHVWYTEPQRNDLTVWLNAEGQEVAVGEGTESHYLTDKHPNAIMCFGE